MPAIRTAFVTTLLFVFLPAASLANTIAKVEPNDYSNKVRELNAACKEKNISGWGGFCLSRNYGPVSITDTGQTSITLGQEVATLELIYRNCEHSDFPTMASVVAKAKTIFETQKFFDEIKPQDEAIRNYAGRFFSCRSKSENDAIIANRLQYLNSMIRKYASSGAAVPESPDASLEASKSVWQVKQLSCNGFVAHELVRSPDATEIGRTGIVRIPNMQMDFVVPSIPDLPIKTIRLAFDDRGRKVVDHYILFSRSDLEDPFAAVMVTELPASIDTTQKALGAAVAGERSNLQGTSAQPTLERINTPWGEGLDIFVPNRIGSPCFPAARFKLTADSEAKPTIGLSRFITMPGRLIQFAIVLPVTLETPIETQKANARRVMDVYVTGLRVR